MSIVLYGTDKDLIPDLERPNEVITQMSEEIVKLGKRKLQKGLTYDQVIHLFFKQASGVVKDTIKILRNELAADEQLKLLKVEVELLYFFLFALDYWWQMSSYTQKQKRILDEVFGYHLREWCGYDTEGRAMWDTLQERFIAYSEIVNEQMDDSAKLHSFAVKLSEYCGVGFLYFTTPAPSLFTTALKTVSVLAADKKESK